jgi:hypothetical protein
LTNDPPNWRVAGRPSASKITKLPVLYQQMKGKAHGYFINTQAQLSCQTH